VQSELTTKTVAENCLALTADAVNRRQSADIDEDEPTPNVIQRGVVDANEEDATIIERFHAVVAAQRRDSYLQAIMHADGVPQVPPQPVDVDVDLGVTASASADELHQSALDTVAELEEPHADEPSKEPGPAAETTVEERDRIRSPEPSPDEMPEREEEARASDESSTRADVLDSGSEELDVVDTEPPPVAAETETIRSPSASVEDDFAAYDCRDPEKSHLPDVEPPASRLNNVSPLPSEDRDEMEDVVWISRTTGDIPPTDCAANKPEPPQERDSSTGAVPVPDQSDEGRSSVPARLSPPPPPIDVIAIDVTWQLVSSDNGRRDLEERPSDADDDDYCHSPLGGAMPESEDSSVAEFVFP